MKNSWVCLLKGFLMHIWAEFTATEQLRSLVVSVFVQVWLKLLLHWCHSHKPALSNTNDSLYGYQASGTTSENRRRSWQGVFTGRASPSLPFYSISAGWHAAYHVTTLKSVVNHCLNFTSRIWPLLVMIGSGDKHTLHLSSSTSL